MIALEIAKRFAKMKVDLFSWQHFSGRLLSAGERTKCTQFPSLGHRCIQPDPSFSAPPTNNFVNVSMIISLLYITISIIYQLYRQPPTNKIVSVVDINISYNITIATSTLLYDVQYEGEVMKMSDVFKGWILIPQFMQTGHNCLISARKEKE